MSKNPMYALLDGTSREAQRFSEHFFRQVDAREAPPSSISDTTTIVWNGTPLAGPAAFHQMVQQSPNMKHELSGLDVQPFPNGDVNAINMIVSVSGKVKLGDQLNRNDDYAMSAQLVVRRLQPNAPLTLQTMSYRLVHKPADSTLET